MGQDDNMEKKAIYLSGTLEWNGVRTVLDNGRIEDTCVHCYVSWENCRRVSTPLCDTVDKGRRLE